MLALHNVEMAFDGKTVLEGITFTFKASDRIALIGENGSGKSTLIQHFNGLLRPTRGAVYIDGVDIGAKGVKMKELRQKVGLVFQYPEHQLFEETVFDDVAFGPRNLGLSEEEIASRVREALSTVGLNFEEVKGRSPFELSGGQMRRVAIAGVLAMRPKILILDEPAAGLDPRGRDEVLTQAKMLHEKRGMTVILVSHSMEDVARLVERIIVMHRGKVVLDGKTREVFRQAETLKSIGLGVPQVAELMLELSRRGKDVRADVLTVEEAKGELLGLLRREGRV